MSRAHVFESQERTRDVQINEDVTFEGLILSESTLKGLTASGFERPSPIQLVGIPLGKAGFDLIAEAKSGTGKTVMFGVIALEMLQLPSKSLQVLILTPTREIAAQVGDVLTNIGSGNSGLKVAVFIGGLPVEEDRRRARHCHIAVGTPGRLKHLIDDGLLDVSHVRLIIIDEADKLLEPSFEPDIVHIFKTLPLNKQVIAASATYTPELKVFLEDFMRSPLRVNPDEKCLVEGSGVLLGVRQVAALVPYQQNYLNKMNKKINALVAILSSVPFKQCIVFNNSHGIVETISGTLNSKGWPTEFLSSGIDQPARLKVIKKFHDFKCRVLLSTDLISRGIDVANVNLVINFDVPMTSATYLHRVGRSGRFGTEGLAVTIVEENSKDLTRLIGVVKDLKIPMDCLKVDSATPLQQNIFTCDLPTLLSEVPAEVEIKVATQEPKKDAENKSEGDSESGSSEEGRVGVALSLSSGTLAKAMSESDKVNTSKVESESSSSDDESDSVASSLSSDTLDKVSSEGTKEGSESDSSESSGVIPLPSDNDALPKKEVADEAVDEMEIALKKELTEMYRSGKSAVDNTPQSPQKLSPQRRLPFSTPRSEGYQRREYAGRGSPHYSRNLSLQHSPRGSPRKFDSSTSSNPYSSNCSTPRKDFGTEKLVSNFARYSDEQPRSRENPNPTSYTARALSSNRQLFYQQQFEMALNNLCKDIRRYEPPKVAPVQGYDELEKACAEFDKSAACNRGYVCSEPYLSRTVYRSLTLGMGKRLGVQVNLAKRHFAFNGGLKAYLQMLVEGHEPNEADLPAWEPGQDGFRVNRDCWLYGNDYIKSTEVEGELQEPAPRPTFQLPRQQLFRKHGDEVQLVVPPAPQEHHSFKFPRFPTAPDASLDEWKEQVKLTTFMIHYSEYFRMMNKAN